MIDVPEFIKKNRQAFICFLSNVVDLCICLLLKIFTECKGEQASWFSNPKEKGRR